ncbi:Bug family tripartite tricarboxylate transporter substrate binding protein [Rhodovarius sp.]|uniref:Bug family tripartite tricarboxylate transporter substrate binding protein n=1 Tax=Rhodovarius sp. TaxID=2972673 RepID=UPI0034A19938
MRLARRAAMNRRKFVAAASMIPLVARAQCTWPERPIRAFVPFAPGTATDNLARVVIEPMGVALGQPIVIENRAGAGGAIGAQAAARSAPDGYALLFGSATTQAANVSLIRNLPYDPARDFSPISRLAHIAQVLVVHPSVPAQTVQEFVAWLRANPGKNFASASSGNLAPAAFLVKRLGLEAQGVTYRSPPQALTDVMAGVVPFMFIDMSAVLGHVRAGAVRALAVTSATPSALLPEVPPLAATVLPGFELLTWMGLYGPAGLPEAMVNRLNAEARAALARPEIIQRLLAMGFEARSSTPAELGEFNRSEIEKWRGLVAETAMEVT